MEEELKAFLEAEGYRDLRVIPGRGVCGIRAFMFTNAIVYGLDMGGYIGRYCYPHEKIGELIMAYALWDGKEDPLGQWIKHKGGYEYINPNYYDDGNKGDKQSDDNQTSCRTSA